MPRTNSKSKNRAKRDLYQEVTDTIIEAIEADPGRWTRPWRTGPDGVPCGDYGMPFNATTGSTYRGVNVLLLWHRAARLGFETNAWASYNQWLKRGAQVRKGERGSTIVFFRTIEREGKDGGDPERIPVLRHYTVFNADQVDGYTPPTVQPQPLVERIEAAGDYVANTGAKVEHGGSRAFYSPFSDHIGMPYLSQFRDTDHGTAAEHYQSTLLHELVHWTGHRDRIDRELRNRFGDDGYAAEELIAELGAAFLCAELGIDSEPRQDHAQYLASWLRVLKSDKRAIFTAAARASEAAEYLDRFQYDDDGDGGREDVPDPATPALPPPPAALPTPSPAPAIAANSNRKERARTAPATRRPVLVGGVKVVPGWDWSPTYRRYVQAQARALAEDNRSDAHRNKDQAIAYARWLADRDGVPIAPHLEPVIATALAPDGCYRVNKVTFFSPAGTRRDIHLPNWDFVPSVHITTDADAA